MKKVLFLMISSVYLFASSGEVIVFEDKPILDGTVVKHKSKRVKISKNLYKKYKKYYSSKKTQHHRSKVNDAYVAKDELIIIEDN